VRIVAVDPGGATGLARYDSETDALEALQLPPLEACAWVEQSLSTGTWDACPPGAGADLVVAEFFTISGGTLKKSRGGSYDALHTFGAVKYLAWRAGVEFASQRPAEAMGLVSDGVLRAMGMYVTGDHARDAVRHVVLAGVKRRAIAPERLVGR
jgi:hypothetical protein